MNVNDRVFITSAVTAIAAVAVAAALTLGVERIHAQPLPLDECTKVGNAAPMSRLCLHEFTDHTKCVISVTRGSETPSETTTALSCKIT